MVFDPSLLSFVNIFDAESFGSFSVDFHWRIGVGLPVAEHETVTSESELDEFTDAVISDIPEKHQKRKLKYSIFKKTAFTHT